MLKINKSHFTDLHSIYKNHAFSLRNFIYNISFIFSYPFHILQNNYKFIKKIIHYYYYLLQIFFSNYIIFLHLIFLTVYFLQLYHNYITILNFFNILSILFFYIYYSLSNQFTILYFSNPKLVANFIDSSLSSSIWTKGILFLLRTLFIKSIVIS